MKLGGITLDNGLFGAYNLINKPADKLPQELATAVSAVNAGVLGATFVPIWYVGTQLVNGTNHLLLCYEVRSTRNRDTAVVGLVINIPPATKEHPVVDGTNASVYQIIDEVKLPQELALIFDIITNRLIGVKYKPIAYMGNQVVRGVNYYFLCESKVIGIGVRPEPVVMCINVFEGNVSLVSIEKLVENSPQAEAEPVETEIVEESSDENNGEAVNEATMQPA